jgi:hypothetical protein
MHGGGLLCTLRKGHAGEHNTTVKGGGPLVCYSCGFRRDEDDGCVNPNCEVVKVMNGTSPPPAKYQDSGIGKVAAFDAAEKAVYEAFRWYCCDPNADQKRCEDACPRKQALAGIQRGRDLLLMQPAAEMKAAPTPEEK